MKLNRTSSQDKAEEAEHRLYEAISLIQSIEEAKKFLQDLCTPSELQAMADRWRVVDEIKAGKPYRQIHDETGVSVTTIGRVARNIMMGEGGYNIIYERQEKQLHENSSKTTNRNSKERASK